MKIKCIKDVEVEDQRVVVEKGKTYDASPCPYNNGMFSIVNENGTHHSFYLFNSGIVGSITETHFIQVEDDQGGRIDAARAKALECLKTVEWHDLPVETLLAVTDALIDSKLGLAEPGTLTISKMCKDHHAWVKRSWPEGKTPLESLALVGSELGEAVDELPEGHPFKARIADLLPVFARAVNACRNGGDPDPNFGIELADIVLRTADLAEELEIDLEAVIIHKMKVDNINGT